MSGYLRRLAAAVNNPTSNVHPMAGSVFAGAKAEFPTVVEEEQILAPRLAEGPAAQARAESSISGEPKIAEQPRLLLQNADPVINSARPSEQAARASADSTPARAHVSFGAVRKAEGPRPSPVPQPGVVEIRAEALGPAQGGVLDSLIETKEEAPISARMPEPPSVSYTQPPSRSFARTSAAARSSSGPDEVEIHIGRIEITAVTPPASHPPPKPARKTPSLSEYLQRGRR